MTFRNGMWLKFDNAAAGAHQSADGKTVGIFVKGGVDGTGQTHADRVMVVDPDGNNILAIADGQVKNIEIAPGDLVNPEPLDTVEDVPAKRRANMREGFLLAADRAKLEAAKADADKA